jgi:hypothetical protein
MAFSSSSASWVCLNCSQSDLTDSTPLLSEDTVSVSGLDLEMLYQIRSGSQDQVINNLILMPIKQPFPLVPFHHVLSPIFQSDFPLEFWEIPHEAINGKSNVEPSQSVQQAITNLRTVNCDPGKLRNMGLDGWQPFLPSFKRLVVFYKLNPHAPATSMILA